MFVGHDFTDLFHGEILPGSRGLPGGLFRARFRGGERSEPQWNRARKSGGQNWPRPTLICSLDMILRISFMAKFSLDPGGCQGASFVRCSAEASVASRSGTAHERAAARIGHAPPFRAADFYPCLIAMFHFTSCFSCAGRKIKLAPLRKRRPVACASSCNPWTASGQSGAQPERRTPYAPSSNRCRSGSPGCQLVSVRMS